MKPKRTLVLVADGGSAHFYRHDGPTRGLEPIPEAAMTNDLVPAHEMKSDRPGRVQESASSARHAVDPGLDPHRAAKTAFAQAIALRLGQAQFDRLLLVAPPRMLGDLRQALPSKVASRLAGEIGKDLTRAPREQLLQAVAKLLPV